LFYKRFLLKFRRSSWIGTALASTQADRLISALESQVTWQVCEYIHGIRNRALARWDRESV